MTTQARARAERWDPATYEATWRRRWEADELDRARDDDPREKQYVLTMYPYPSGDLHIGHWYASRRADVVGALHRMRGDNVFFPMGFDAFGLPAENAAIKRGVHPRDLDLRATSTTCARQFRTMGAHVRLEPRGGHLPTRTYYRWNQWLFLQFFKAGLAYGRWRRSTGAPRTRSCWRASRWWAPTASAGAAARRSSSATWSSGSSASPATPTSCWTSRASTGRSRSG